MEPHYKSIAIILMGMFIGVAARPWERVPHDGESSIPSDTLGTRPLRFIMVGLGQEMSRIGDGLWHEDYEMIGQAARLVADHPRVTAAEMAAIKTALGDRFQSFVAFDQFVHHTAVELDSAATALDTNRILDAYGRLQNGCVSCHATFRAEVRAALY